MFQASGHHPLFMIPGQQTDYKVSSYKCLQIGPMGCKVILVKFGTCNRTQCWCVHHSEAPTSRLTITEYSMISNISNEYHLQSYISKKTSQSPWLSIPQI